MSQREAVMGLIRALSGGEVEEREIVKVVRRLHGTGVPPVALADALVSAMERAAAHDAAIGGVARALGLAGAAVFGGIGAAFGLYALGAALPSFTRAAAMLPLAGVALIALSLKRSAQTGRDPLALSFSILHELAAAGVPFDVARDAAAYAAGERKSTLLARLDSEPLPPEIASERTRAAVIVARLADARPVDAIRSRARRWVVVSALWILASFWALWLRGLTLGFAEAW